MAISGSSYTLCSCNVACPCDLCDLEATDVSGTKEAMNAEHKPDRLERRLRWIATQTLVTMA